MNEQERIEAMVREGRITRDEADRLLTVLSDMDEFDSELGSVEDRVTAVDRAGSDEVGTGPAHAGDAEARGGPGAETAVLHEEQRRNERERSGSAPRTELRWVDVELMAGDVRVSVDESLTAPVASTKGAGKTELEETGEGYRYRGTGSSTDDGLIGRFIGSMKAGRTDLAIPAGYGLRLDMKAGHVDITGPIPFLTGHLLAADLDARELHGVDLTVSAGDVDLALRIDEGENRIKAIAGDLNVRLLPGSDVSVSGTVSIGDLSLPREWRHRSRGLGNDFEHELGEGRGRLRIELGTGDLDVEADRE